MMNKTVYYERKNSFGGVSTYKGVVVGINGDRCVVRRREAYTDNSFIFSFTNYRDVDTIVKTSELIIEGADDAQSYINQIRSLTGTTLTNDKIIDTALRLIVRLVGYGVPLKDAEINKIGRVYALGYFNNKSVDEIKLDELAKALVNDQKRRGKKS